MTSNTQSLVDQVLRLPFEERFAVAQVVWDSLDEASQAAALSTDDALLEELLRRDSQMEQEAADVMTHEQLMAAVNRARSCESATTAESTEN